MKISLQSLYAAFKSKAELYREALDWYQGNVDIFTRRILEEGIDIKIALNKLLRASIVEFTRQGRSQGCMISTAVLSCATENEDIAAYVAHMRSNTIALFEQLLRKAVTDGQLAKNTDAKGMPYYLSAVIQGLFVQANDGVGNEIRQRIADIAIRSLL